MRKPENAAPSPSCIRQKVTEISVEAEKLLTSAIENPNLKRQKKLIPTDLIIRETTKKKKTL
ncbi:hypothetical protein BIV60_14995 [Bacillus sp. MUM 116]|nr:hypothetical protein BIV60_14995 [Bacillus sp. MUM 116]